MGRISFDQINSSLLKIFHIILEALIMLLLYGPQSLSGGGTLVRAIEVADEHGT
jgi:hypothetical protein